MRGGGSSLITFTVDGVEYQAEEGMTWGEWVDSEYDVNGNFYIDFDDLISSRDDFGLWVGTKEWYVFTTDIIQENYNYVIVG